MPHTTSWNIGVGITCFIGAVGGMYLAFRGYKHIKKVKNLQHNNQNRNEFCPVCNTKIDSLVDTNWITCINCAQIVCRKPKCSNWIASRGQSEWECQLCHDQRQAHFKASEWLLTQLSKKLQITNALDLGDISVIDYDNQLDELNESDVNGTVSVSQKEYIRTFLEDLLSTLLGGSLDNVLVGPIRKNSDYLPICDHPCPGLAQANLKRLIQKIIAEAARLPELFNRSGVPPRPEEHLPYFDPKKYNQLLATAVLNKVVESYHNPRNQILTKDECLTPNVDINQNTVKPEKETDTPKQNEIAPKPSESPKTSAMKVETQRELQSPATASSATSQSAYSDDDSESSEQLLETLIKQQKTKTQLPDLTSDETNDDEYNSIKSAATDSTWEDNWMFKTKKNTNDGTSSIAMLIPSPTEDIKVLIGDRTADEISDLSDNHDSENDDEYSNSSDSLSDSDDQPADIPNVLVQNKTVIGGKHPLTDFIENASDFESLTSQNSFSEAKNDLLISDDGDFVKVDKPLMDIEYSTLDMKNGNVEKMKEAINPYVERKVNENSTVVVEKGDDSVKIEKNVVSPTVNPNTNEIIVDTPVPAPRKSSKGDLPTPNNASPKPDDAFGNICLSQNKIHPTAIHKRKLIAPYCPDEDYSIDLLPIIDIGTQIDDHETILHAIYISSPPPLLLLLPTPPQHHDVIATKIINISDHDDDDDDDDEDDDDEEDDDVDDSDFDLISVNSSEFSFYKPRNLNSRDDNSSVASPIEKNKFSFVVSNEEICKEILEMVAKQPQDIVVSTIPAVKEETKITISQTVWQPLSMNVVDKATRVTDDEPIDESSKSLDSIISPVESDDNFLSLQSVEQTKYPDAHHSLMEGVEEKPETTDIKDQLSEIFQISRQIECTLNEIMINNNQEDEIPMNTISDHVVVKEYIPEDTDVVEETWVIQVADNNPIEKIIELIPTNDTEVVVAPKIADVMEGSINVNDEVRTIEETITEQSIQTTEAKVHQSQVTATQKIDNTSNPQKCETTELKQETVEITELIEKLEIISVTEHVSDLKEPQHEPTAVILMEKVHKPEVNLQEVKIVEISAPETVAKPTIEELVLVTVLEEVRKMEDIPVCAQKAKTVEVVINKSQIPTIEITPHTPVSTSFPDTVQKLEEKLLDVTISNGTLSVEVDTRPTIEIQIPATKLKESLPEYEPGSVNGTDIIRKIEEKLDAPEAPVVDVKVSNTELNSNEPLRRVEIRYEISDSKLDEVTREPGQIIVTEEVKKIEEKLEEISLPQQIPVAEIQNFKELVITEEIRKVEKMYQALPFKTSLEPAVLSTDLKELHNIAAKINRALEPQIQTADLRETTKIEVIPNDVPVTVNQQIIIIPTEPQNVDTVKPIEIRPDTPQIEKPAINFQIQTMDLKEIEPVSVVVAEVVRKIEEHLEDNDNRPTKIRHNEIKEEGIKVESREVAAAVHTSQIIEETLERSVIEPQRQTSINEIGTNEPIPVIAVLADDLKEIKEVTSGQIIEGKLEDSLIKHQIITEEIRKIDEKSLPLEIDPQIETSDLRKVEEIITNAEISVITTDEVPQIKPKVEEVKSEMQEITAVLNDSQIVEEKLEESIVEHQIQTNEVKEIGTNEPVSAVVMEKVRKFEEKSLPLEADPDEVRKSKLEEILSEIQASTATVNESPIIEAKLGETIAEPQLQTTEVKKIETNKPVSVIVTKEVQKIEEKSLLLEIGPQIHTTDLKKVEELIANAEISVITTDEVPQIKPKVEEVKSEIQEITAALNESQITEEKLEESIIEPQIQTTEVNEIGTNEPVSVIVTEEVQKIEEKSLPIGIYPKIETTDLKKVEEPSPKAEISVITTDEVSQIKPKIEEIKSEIEEITLTVNESQIVEEKLEESIVEPQIQTTEVKEIGTNEPVSVMITEEVRKIEEKSLPLEIDPKIHTTDLKKVEELIANAEISVITTDEIPQIKPKVEEVKSEIQEITATVNESQIIEQKLEESLIEPTIQTTEVNEIGTNEIVSVIVTKEVWKIEEKSLPLGIDPKIQTIDLNKVDEPSSNVEISVITTDEVSQIKPKIEEIKSEIEEITATVNESQIIEEKLEEPLIEPTIQTTEVKSLGTNEPVSIIVTEELRKIETCDLKKVDDIPSVQISVITTDEVWESKLEGVKSDIQEITITLNESQIIEEKLEEYVVEPQIHINEIKTIGTNEPVSVIVMEEVRKLEEKSLHLEDDPDEVRKLKVEEIKSEMQEITASVNESQIVEEKLEESIVEPQIQISEVKEIETNEPVSVIVTEKVWKIEEKSLPLEADTDEVRKSKLEEIKSEIEEITATVNESQIIQEKLEESVVDPVSIIVTKEVRIIEEKTLPVQIEPQMERVNLNEIVVAQEISIITNDEVPQIMSKVEEIKSETEEITVTLNESQIVEEKLEEFVVEPQILTTEVKEFGVVEPVLKEKSLPVKIDLQIQSTDLKEVEEVTPPEYISVITIQDIRESEKVDEVKQKIQEVAVILTRSEIVEETLQESVIESQIQNSDVKEIEINEPESVIVVEELQKIETKLDDLRNVDSLPEEIKPQIQTTKLKETEKVTPIEEVSVISIEPVPTIETKVEEIKKEVQEITVSINASKNIEENVVESVIDPIEKRLEQVKTELDQKSINNPQIQTTDVKVPFVELNLPKMNATLESVPQIKLVEFRSFPIVKESCQTSTIHSPEPLQVTGSSEIEPKQVSPPIDEDYVIITNSEIKTIPKEIESIMKSSKLVAGLTKKVSTVSLTLNPVTTVVIEKPSNQPKLEADEVTNLTLSMQTIEQKQPESRYSSPLFKPLLPRSPPPPVVKVTKVDTPKATTNITNTSTSSIIVDTTTTTTTTTTTPVTKTNEEDEVIFVEVPIPGSIAEREHNKWQNAAPIANNPYSVEVLERRLSQKLYDSPTFKTNEPSYPIENGKPVTQEKHLVDVFKAEVPSLKRFGRDYYINEAKKASGERLRRSELLNRQLHNDSTSSEDHVNDSEYQNFLYVRAATEQFVENEQQSNDYPLKKSKSSGDTNRLMNENIFAARPIMVEEDDPILERAQRVEALSTDDRDFFLLPIEEAQMNIGFSSSEASSLRSPSSLSEDSDTARIYNLRSQEIKKVKEPESNYIPPALKPKMIPKSPIVIKPQPTFLPVATPPPIKLSANTKIMSKSVPMFDTSPEFGQANKPLADDINNNIAIEEDIKHVLPSVKNLAKAFTETKDKPAPGPINKPKTPWHSTSNLSKPGDSEVPPSKPQPVKISETFIRPGYSISGRSISKQVKDELREIKPKLIDSNNNHKQSPINKQSTVNSNTKVVTPPRTPSPTPVPGALRNTLAFFENLNHKH